MISLRRLKKSKAAQNAGASYAAFFTNTACGLFTIPLAVAFLGKEQIALWTIVSQIVSYLLWLDMGVGDAIGRKIAEPVARNDRGEINAWWTLSIGVLAVQGMLMMLLAIPIWPLWLSWFSIGAELRTDALWLYTAAIGVAALAMPLRAYPGVLLAQHRFVWIPVAQTIMPLVQIAVFYAFLRAGWGVRAYFVSLLASQLCGWTIFVIAVHRAGTRPGFTRGAFTKDRFRSLFGFSASLAVVGFTRSLTNTLPTILLGRLGTLALIPVYGFTGRGPSLLSGVGQRTTHAFYPGLQRLYVDGHRERFMAKYVGVQKLAVAIGLGVAGAILCGNRSLVSWLAAPDYFAGPAVNLWFAVFVIVTPFNATLAHLFQYSGNMGKSAFVACTKLAAGALLGWAGYKHFGMAGLAAVFALLPLLTTAPYAAFRGARNCGMRPSDLCAKGVLWLAAAMSLVMIAAMWIGDSAHSHQLTVAGRTGMIPTWREWFAGLALAMIAVVAAYGQLRKIRAS